MHRLHRLRYLKNLRYLGACLTVPFLLYHNSPIYCRSEVKQLSQQMFVQDILGNRKDYYFLVIYKEAVDGGYGEKEALEVAKKLQEIASKLSIDCHVYTISRPSLNSITKLIDRVKTIKIYEMEDAQKIEIYFKTPHQDDYVYFPFKKHSFYSENKLDKIYNHVSRYTQLYHKVSTQEELDALILENFYLLDSPLFLKSNTNDKAMKLFKRVGFQFLERKTVNLKSKFVIIDNKELCDKLKLKDDDILIMRNDILQKYENCKLNDQFLIPQVINKEQFNNIQFESFNQWRANQKIEPSPQKEQKQKFIHDFQLFTLPRVSYLKNSKKPTIGTLVKRIQFHQNQSDKLVVSLQLDPQNQSRIDYHIRLQVFFKLYEKYKDRCLFVISATNQLEELLPHLNKFHSHFTLFNIFNSISYSKQLFPKTAKLYEKYFLKDHYFVERFEVIDNQMSQLLQKSPEQRIENIDYISQDLDTICEINLDYFNYLQQQSNNKCIVLYYQRDIMTDALLQVLKNIKTKYQIYTISMLNQIPQLYQFSGQNVLILNGTAIGLPVLQDVNLNELKQQIENLIQQ